MTERGEKRPWTRRTRILIEPIPQDVFKPEIIEGIKARDERITPYDALTAFGFEIDEAQTDYLNTLVREVDYQLFLGSSEEETTFACKDIDAFVKLTASIPFELFEISKISPEDKEAILRNAPVFLSQVALERRTADWQR